MPYMVKCNGRESVLNHAVRSGRVDRCSLSHHFPYQWVGKLYQRSPTLQLSVSQLPEHAITELHQTLDTDCILQMILQISVDHTSVSNKKFQITSETTYELLSVFIPKFFTRRKQRGVNKYVHSCSWRIKFIFNKIT